MASSKEDNGTSPTTGAGPGANKVDPFFMASMTFAHGVERDCDCDECGLEPLPPSIAEAVRKHKRAKLMSVVEITHQERQLIGRDGGLSIWRLKLPVGSEPLVEYGNSHRIVLVQHMSKGVEVKSIGTGIVGSAAEEKARTSVGWNDGGGYVIPSNGGKAAGWVCTTKDDKDELSDGNVSVDSVDIVVIKATHEALVDDDGDESAKSWTKAIKKIFNEELPTNDNDGESAVPSSVETKELARTCIAALQQHIEELAESN
eukprot:CAMPEP_0197718062 /NCGR_PEP_ID=MMETSP1434-20131217/2366_1 /TAXON_ID=265543 /ORGANISM="Minutocellus polymorphus, Strain CCMP3303" /LENGTH=258 /DNA_ID=CAMNT_0043302669 /DNA_START=24 /DNA_END=800 /DNA_ORIENTATION=-